MPAEREPRDEARFFSGEIGVRDADLVETELAAPVADGRHDGGRIAITESR